MLSSDIMGQQLKDQNILNKKAVQINLEIIIHKIQESELMNYMKKKSRKVRLSTLRDRLSKIKGSLSEEIVKDREERL